MASFYAVAIGKITGIYTSWDDCKLQVEDYKGAVYKKFLNLEDAKAFLNDFLNNLYIYTDGACSNNGKSYAKAGCGIYFAKDHPLNQSFEIKGENLTNNIAELYAVITAIKLIKDIQIRNKIIVTDSEYVIKCATTYGTKLAAINWQPKKDKIIPNLELVQELYNLTHEYGIKYKHIMAHTGEKDKYSIGNYYADLLANKAIGIDPSVVKQSNKIYLNVPYAKKEDAKSKGARWDAGKKQWYIYEDNKNKEELFDKYKK